MSSTVNTSIFSSAKIEDILLLISPFVTAIIGSNILGLFPGTTGFILGAVFGALAKALVGLGQNQDSYEDLLLFGATFLGLLGSVLTSNQSFAIVGLILGSIAKAIPSLQAGINYEDVFLFVGAVLSAIGLGAGVTALVDVGVLLSTMGKALPSLGQVGTSPTPVVAAPVPKTP